MNKHEATLIAAAANQLRPDWPVRQLMTLLGHASLRDRPRRDVAVALAWVACEPNTASPYRVLEAGPWWRAAAIDGATGNAEKWDPSSACGVCSLPRQRCRMVWTGDHDFTPASSETDTESRISELRDLVQPTRTYDKPATKEEA